MATILICLLLGVNIHATEIFTPDSIKQATIEKNAVIRVKGTVRKLEDYTKSKYYKELRFDLFNEKTELFVYVYYRYESENKTIAEKNIQNGDFVEVEGEFKSSSGKETSRFQGLLKVNQESNKTDFVAKNFKKLEKPITPVSAPIDVTKQPINVSPEKISNTDLAANLLSKCYRQLLLLSFEYAAKYCTLGKLYNAFDKKTEGKQSPQIRLAEMYMNTFKSHYEVLEYWELSHLKAVNEIHQWVIKKGREIGAPNFGQASKDRLDKKKEVGSLFTRPEKEKIWTEILNDFEKKSEGLKQYTKPLSDITLKESFNKIISKFEAEGLKDEMKKIQAEIEATNMTNEDRLFQFILQTKKIVSSKIKNEKYPKLPTDTSPDENNCELSPDDLLLVEKIKNLLKERKQIEDINKALDGNTQYDYLLNSEGRILWPPRQFNTITSTTFSIVALYYFKKNNQNCYQDSDGRAVRIESQGEYLGLLTREKK